MARIETDPNYTSPTFSRATAATDLFKKEDVQKLAEAMSGHDHTTGKGLILGAGSIAAGTITGAMIADGSITTADIADQQISAAKIAPGAVGQGQLADSAVITQKIALNAVISDRIADNNVPTAKLAPNAVHQIVAAVGSTNNPTTTSTSFVDMPDLTVSITTGASALLIHLMCTVQVSSVGAFADLQINVDGGDVGPIAQVSAAATNQVLVASMAYFIPAVSLAGHVVKVRWRAPSGGTLTATWTYRTLIVEEVKR